MNFKWIVAAMITGLMFLQLAEAKDKLIYIDVRTPQEFASGHVEGALNIDVSSPDFIAKIEKLDKSENYKVYCRSGRRSGIALQQMQQLKFKSVENIGGLDDAKDYVKRLASK